MAWCFITVSPWKPSHSHMDGGRTRLGWGQDTFGVLLRLLGPGAVQGRQGSTLHAQKAFPGEKSTDLLLLLALKVAQNHERKAETDLFIFFNFSFH